MASYPPVVRLDRYGDVVLLQLTGRLEGAACHVLHQYLVKVLAARIPPLLVVDLEGLATADPYGRDILLSADRHSRASDGHMFVIGGGVLPALEDGDLDRSPSVDDALAALGARARNRAVTVRR